MKRAAVPTFAIAAILPFVAGSASAEEKVAILAGGCFWSVESNFDKVPGVLSTTSGYIGGTTSKPTYHDHTAAGHREAVSIVFDDAQVSYEELLSVFFHSVDPTDSGGQFCDRGHSYTTAIFALDEAQRAAAGKAKMAAEKELNQMLATDIAAAPQFWPAEDYHQDYYEKNPLRYASYRTGCGRDNRLEQVWGASAFKGIKGS